MFRSSLTLPVIGLACFLLLVAGGENPRMFQVGVRLGF